MRPGIHLSKVGFDEDLVELEIGAIALHLALNLALAALGFGYGSSLRAIRPGGIERSASVRWIVILGR